MNDMLDVKRLETCAEAVIDAAVLDRILGLGDDRMRVALLDQLRTDFRRLAETLGEDDADAVAAAAHELKGLAATIGAHRLAQLAQRLNTVADCAMPAELDAFIAPVRGEIRVVLDTLSRHARGTRS
jgi:HPt (histidine-containing phosphotransfer) domain-containing protein